MQDEQLAVKINNEHYRIVKSLGKYPFWAKVAF